MPIAVKQYSLLDYSLSIYPHGSNSENALNIPIGGLGRYLGSIKFSKSTENVSKTVDATGSGVFSYTNDHSGTVDIEISQVSEQISTIITQIAEKYNDGTNYFGTNVLLDIVMSKNNTPIIEATNCMLVKMPDLVIANEPATRTFSFLSMEIKEKAFTY